MEIIVGRSLHDVLHTKVFSISIIVMGTKDKGKHVGYGL